MQTGGAFLGRSQLHGRVGSSTLWQCISGDFSRGDGGSVWWHLHIKHGLPCRPWYVWSYSKWFFGFVDVSCRKDEQFLYNVLCKSNSQTYIQTMAADPPVAFGHDSGCGEGSLQWAGAKWCQASTAWFKRFHNPWRCSEHGPRLCTVSCTTAPCRGETGLESRDVWFSYMCAFGKASRVAEVKQVLSTWFNKIWRLRNVLQTCVCCELFPTQNHSFEQRDARIDSQGKPALVWLPSIQLHTWFVDQGGPCWSSQYGNLWIFLDVCDRSRRAFTPHTWRSFLTDLTTSREMLNGEPLHESSFRIAAQGHELEL